MIRVKVCCISSIEEAKMAVNAGASALGLVGPMPSGPGIISNNQIKEIAKTIPPGVSSFLLTSNTSVEAIAAHHGQVNTQVVQIVDELSEGSYDDLRALLPGIKIVQVLHVIDVTALDQALKLSQSVDALLLDSGNPNLKTKILGGTGKTHNWDISRKICEQVSKPVYLAGGLNKDNVERAIDYVNPFGLDLCSGLRTNKQLDLKKLNLFFEKIHKYG